MSHFHLDGREDTNDDAPCCNLSIAVIQWHHRHKYDFRERHSWFTLITFLVSIYAQDPRLHLSHINQNGPNQDIRRHSSAL